MGTESEISHSIPRTRPRRGIPPERHPLRLFYALLVPQLLSFVLSLVIALLQGPADVINNFKMTFIGDYVFKYPLISSVIVVVTIIIGIRGFIIDRNYREQLHETSSSEEGIPLFPCMNSSTPNSNWATISRLPVITSKIPSCSNTREPEMRSCERAGKKPERNEASWCLEYPMPGRHGLLSKY